VELIESFNNSREYYKSVEFYDIITKAFEVAVKTSENQKHKMISILFKESINPENEWEDDLKNIFLKIINEFSINHFLVLKFLLTKLDTQKIDSYELLHHDFTIFLKNNKIDVYQFRMYCRDIEYKSIIRFSSNINEINSSGGYIETEDSSKIQSLVLTSLGEKFISLLDDS
jgi:hypothetical protein